MFAVVQIKGKQYKISPDDVLAVDRMEGTVGETVTLKNVLLFSSESGISIGTPEISDVSVKAKILEQGKGEKISVRRYKRKVRYRKARGFRAYETKLQITSISHA